MCALCAGKPTAALLQQEDVSWSSGGVLLSEEFRQTGSKGWNVYFKALRFYASLVLSELNHSDILVYTLSSQRQPVQCHHCLTSSLCCWLQLCRAAASYFFLTSVCCRISVFQGLFQCFSQPRNWMFCLGTLSLLKYWVWVLCALSSMSELCSLVLCLDVPDDLKNSLQGLLFVFQQMKMSLVSLIFGTRLLCVWGTGTITCVHLLECGHGLEETASFIVVS